MAFPNYKDIMELVKKGALTLQEENLALKERLRELEEQLRRSSDLTFIDGFYWLNAKGEKAGPFCQRCQDSDGKLVRLQVELDSQWKWRCLVCESFYR